MNCAYCDRQIRAYRSERGRVVSTGFVEGVPARVRKVENDPDGIAEIHYEHVQGAFHKISHVVTADGPVCPACLKEAKDAKKIKKEKGEDTSLVSEMKAKRDKIKKEKKPEEVPDAI